MKNILLCHFRHLPVVVLLLLVGMACQPQARANPVGGTVVQGSASFNTSGSQFTINQSSSSAFINWQSFNLVAGETTTFVQPSSSSVTWNYINDPSASSINGNINANGYVVLQNPNGFAIGGSATISANGLVMTTASTPAFDLASGGAWNFNAPPPTAKIINYGQINIAGGGSAFLIASDIENNGTISAPGGKIGLYAGEKVLVSTSPDGRGLSAQVTLPVGSVNNQGQLIADAGSIAAQAKFVNQNGLMQANSVQNVNGVIELVASDSLNLGASSAISASGDATAASASPGGFVVLKSDNTYVDTPTSTLNVTGQSGGQDGLIEIFGAGVTAGSIQSSIGSYYQLLINPYDITLTGDTTDTSSSSPILNVNELSGYSQIDLRALDNIELGTVWDLGNSGSAATLSLTAGNNVILDDGSAIKAGSKWNVNLTAGTGLASSTLPTSGNDGIYLNGSAYVQTRDGSININAPNEVIVQGGAIRTVNGGSISVATEYGDVNSGYNVNGYLFGQKKAPYYKVNSANLGGISTAAGGNVTINAGGNVISYLPVQSDYANAQFDAGTGAFGSQPGNVTITAGGNVYGHYVLANGIGTITAGGDIGVPTPPSGVIPMLDPLTYGFALSLINGSWNAQAPYGSIYVQDVRNPNGVFGEKAGSSPDSYAGYHYYNYDPNSSILFQAGDSVEITGYEAPHTPYSSGDGGLAIPMLFPPTLQVITGSGDFIMDTSVILFPSPNQNLNLNIGGDFVGIPNGNPINLEMSDSASVRWIGDTTTFGTSDHGTSPLNVDNPNPVEISVSGNVQDINLYTTKATHMTVGGNMDNSGFAGENLHASDVTYINVAGNIYNSPIYTFAGLGSPIVSANSQQPGVWDSFFYLAVDPAQVAALTSFDANNTTLIGPNGLPYYLKENNYLLFPSSLGSTTQYGSNPGFVYDSASHQLGFRGNMSSALSASQIAALEGGTLTVIVANSQGVPILDANGHIQVTTYHFAGSTAIASLDAQSQGATTTQGLGYLIGGPGQFDINAASLDLGYSPGIISYGFGGPYSYLESVSGKPGFGGAGINVNVGGNINMITSAIGSMDGGNVSVNAGGQMNLSQGTFDFQTSDCYGIYTSGHSDVSVTAGGDINVGGGCIATFNGGNVFVESFNGSVNAGNGANKALFVYGIFLDANGLPVFGEFGDLTDPTALKANPAPYGSGILAEYPTAKYRTRGGNGQPGNITILTPKGNIVSSRGGISQFALNGSIAGGPTVTLEAGTQGVAATADQGNITLGDGGVIGGTINITAQGNIEGLIVSRQNANVQSQQNISITLLSGGTADVASAGATTGTIVGIGGVNVSGAGGVTASLLGQNVSVDGGTAQSTLGTSSGATASSQAAAQQTSQADPQQVASNDSGDDDQKKKKKTQVLHTSRVTVLLSTATTPR